jgi:hypothetical protein
MWKKPLGRWREKMFFSEEKNQKTFVCSPAQKAGDMSEASGIASRAKAFWFFSSKKNDFF